MAVGRAGFLHVLIKIQKLNHGDVHLGEYIKNDWVAHFKWLSCVHVNSTWIEF